MGLFDAIGGVASSLIGYAAAQDANNKGIDAVREQNKGNMDLARYQYEKNIEAWNMQNEYNTPASQMARFKAAGLNPNLIYGSGSGNSGNATSAPQYTAPRLAAYTDFSNEATALSGMMDQVLKAAQVKKTEQETSNLEQYQKNLISDKELKDLEIIGKRFANSKTQAEADVWKEVLAMKIQLMGSEDLLNTYKGQGFLLDNQLKEKYGAEEYEARIGLLKEQKEHSIADRVLMEYRASLITAQVSDLLASANLKYAEKEYYTNLANKVLKDEKLVDKNITAQDILNALNYLKLRGIDPTEGNLMRSIVKHHTNFDVRGAEYPDSLRNSIPLLP